MHPIRRFLGLLNLDRKEITQIYFYAIFSGLVSLSLPLGIQTIVNFIQMGEVSTSWILLVIIVLIGIAIVGLLQVLQLRLVENIQQKIFARSAFEFAFRIPKIQMIKLDNVFMPEIVNRFFDTLTLQKGMPKILIDFSQAIFNILFGLLLLAFYNTYFIGLGVVLFILLLLFYFFSARRGLVTSLKESKFKYKMAHWLEEVARTHRVFRMDSSAYLNLDKTDNILKDYLTARKSHFAVLVWQFRYFVFFKVVLAAGLLLLGGFLVFRQQMNIGQFVAAEIIILLIINSIEKVIQTIETIYDILTGLDKIGFFTDLELDKDDGTMKIDKRRDLNLKMENISFRFRPEDAFIFEKFSLDLPFRTRALVTGKTGSGKTVLMHLLSGLIIPQYGEMLINGASMRNYKRESIYNSIGYCLNKNLIFMGTIRENITLGRKLEDEHLRKTLEILNLNSYIIKTEKGWDTIIDPEGRRLPRSVIQKMQLARAIVHEPKLLLIEEAIYALDPEEVTSIIKHIMSPDRPWTVVVVGNHPEWAKYSNKRIEL